MGLGASIAVDQITKQLELEQHGAIISDDFPLGQTLIGLGLIVGALPRLAARF